MLGGSLVLWAAALRFEAWMPWLWAIDILWLMGLVMDFVRTPAPDRLTVDRSLPERVGLSREFTRRLTLSGAGTAGLRVEVHESFPGPFHVTYRSFEGAHRAPLPLDLSGGPDVGSFEGELPLVLSRGYRSDLRGAFAFGDLRIRVRGPLGLLERQARVEGEQRVEIEPALLDLGRTLRLAASERWQDLGVRLLKKRGGETEFESLREYSPGDDVRRVDWKAFARRGKPMIRQYEVERGQELILLIDRGRRMRVATAQGRHRGWTKLDWALDTGLQLAAVALSKGDRVGVASFERGLETWVSPAKGARQLTRLSRALFELQPSSREADLGRALRELAARHRRTATVIILSDVADPYSVTAQARELRASARRHRLVFAALDDPGLRAAAEGSFAPEELEPGGRGEPLPASVRAAALELVGDRRRSLASLATSGVRVLDALPADCAAPLLAAWLEERRR